MLVIGSWNVWGINSPHKQYAVKSWINQNRLEIFGLLETRITANNLDSVQAKILPPNWKAMSNIQYNPHCRIIVGWNAQHMHIQCIEASAQWLTCEIQNHPTLLGTRLTFVYGSNKPNERADLWSYIHAASDRHHQTPWAILGDFNAILRPSDRNGGSMDWTRQHDAFSDCIMQSSLRQTPYSGIHLTWHNGQEGGGEL